MSFLCHIFIVLGYSIISAAVALMLSRFFSGIDPNTSIMLGAVVPVGSALHNMRDGGRRAAGA